MLFPPLALLLASLASPTLPAEPLLAEPHPAKACPTATYPIPAAPLRVLCEQSDLILTARVGPTLPFRTEDSWEDSVVRLDPLDLLHGELPPGPLEVRYARGLICPAPASYLRGERVLAFLRLDPDGSFRTQSLSYGTKYPDDEGLAAYRERILEHFATARAPLTEEGRLTRTVEWLVRCAEHPATRWEGVLELTRAPRPEALAGDRVPDFGARLEPGQRTRLLEAFLACRDLTGNAICLIPLFADLDDERIAPFLLQRLDDVRDDPTWNAVKAARELVRRSHSPDRAAAVTALEQVLRNTELATEDPSAFASAKTAALDALLALYD